MRILTIVLFVLGLHAQMLDDFLKRPAASGPAVGSPSQRLAWLNYVAKIFWKAGNYRGLYRVDHYFQQLSITGGTDLPVYLKGREKLRKRMQIINKNLIKAAITDKGVAAITDRLIDRGYHPGLELLKQLRGPRKQTPASMDDLKALTLSFGMIKFDSVHQRPKVPLWEIFWKLKIDHKIAIMNYASALRKNRQLAPPTRIPHRHAVKARIRLVMGESIDELVRVPEIRSDALEQRLLRAYWHLTKGDYCGAIVQFRSGLRYASEDARHDLGLKIQSWQRKCKTKRISTTYAAFCQTEPGTEFPIAEVTRREPNAKTLLLHERLFWTSIWTGDCVTARGQLAELKKSIRPLMVTHSLVRTRLAYMKRTLTQCTLSGRNKLTFQGSVGARVLALLKAGNGVEAQRVAKAANDRHLYFGTLVAQYPKASYSPCLGGSVVSGSLEEDLKLLELVDQIAKSPATVSPCNTGDVPALVRRMQAFYIAGNLEETRKTAKLIPTTNENCQMAVQILACLELCSKDPAMAKKAVKHLEHLVSSAQDQPNIQLAKMYARERAANPQAMANPARSAAAEDHLKPMLDAVAPEKFKKGPKGQPNIPGPKNHAGQAGGSAGQAGSSGQAGSAGQAGRAANSAGSRNNGLDANGAPLSIPLPSMAPKQAKKGPCVSAAKKQTPCGAQAAAAPCAGAQIVAAPCGSCGGALVDGIPVNPVTKKPYTPEELKQKIEANKAKKLKDCQGHAQAAVKKKLQEQCLLTAKKLEVEFKALMAKFACKIPGKKPGNKADKKAGKKAGKKPGKKPGKKAGKKPGKKPASPTPTSTTAATATATPTDSP